MSSIRGVYIYVALLVASMGVLADAQCTNGQMVAGSGGWLSYTNGEVITLAGGLSAVKFTSSGTFTAAVDLTATFLVVGGGGSGGSYAGGGGGGGYVVHSQGAYTNAGTYTVTVGTGGKPGGTEQPGNSGGASFIKQGDTTWLTASGGGTGGGWPYVSGTVGYKTGGSGCCAGGGAANVGYGIGTGGVCSGETSKNGANSGGGGGMGVAPVGTAGGKGLAFAYSGTSVYYGEGGAAMKYTTPAVGGYGNGGYGACIDSGTFKSIGTSYRRYGVDGTGSGGGGGDFDTDITGGKGGDGVVYVVVSTSFLAPPPTCTCNTGYYRTDTSTCTACATGTYSNGGVVTSCSACTNGNAYSTYTGPGTTATNCPTSCVSGAYKSSGVCTPCGSGTYSPGGGVTTCSACTKGNAYSTYTGPGTNATNCPMSCVAGTYLSYTQNSVRLEKSCGTSGTDACAVSSSSNYLSTYPASNAIDGDITTFMHTSLTDANPWLQLDFGVTREVRGGTLWNRQECCPERLDGAKIWVGNSATYNGAGNQNCFTYPTGGVLVASFTCTAVGRYFFVQGTTSPSGLSYPLLGIGEVQVLGSTEGHETCTSCGAGTYSTGGGSSVCLTCPAGNYCPTTGLSAYTPCQTCGTGGYQSTICPPGSTSDVSVCTCNPGYYTIGVSTVANPIPCSACPAGTYSSTVGATSYPCIQCPAGTYSSLTARTNSLACVPCLPGSFGPTPGSIEGPPQ